jgi:hypothetical protein
MVRRNYLGSKPAHPNRDEVEIADQPWDEIAGIGNLLRHHYERIDDLIMGKSPCDICRCSSRSSPQ